MHYSLTNNQSTLIYICTRSLPITILLRLTIQRTVSRSFQGSIRAAEEAAKENERDRAPLFYTPGPMSQGAAGKSKKKKEERPKNVLGAPLPSKRISSTLHPFLLLINSLPHTPNLSVYQPPSAVFFPLFIIVSSLKACASLPGLQTSPSSSAPSLLHSPLSSQSCHISRDGRGSSGLQARRIWTLGPKI